MATTVSTTTQEPLPANQPSRPPTVAPRLQAYWVFSILLALTSAACRPDISAGTPVSSTTPGLEPTSVSTPTIHTWPGELYQTVLSLPIGEDSIQYRGQGVAEMQVSGPSSLAILPDGTIVIPNHVDNRLFFYHPDGQLERTIDLTTLGIVNVSDVKAGDSELFLLEISYNVSPLRYRVSRLSFAGDLIAQYDIPAGYHLEDGLWGLATGSDAEILLELGGESFRVVQLASPDGDFVGEIPGIPAYGKHYQVTLTNDAERAASIDAGSLHVETKGTLGGGLLRLLAAFPDGSFLVIREDMVDDLPVILSDVTVHYLNSEGVQIGVARYPIAEWYYPIWPSFMAAGRDGYAYALMPREDSLDILRLNYFEHIDPLIPGAAEPFVGPAQPASTFDCASVESLPPNSSEAQAIVQEFIADFRKAWLTEYMDFYQLWAVDRVDDYVVLQGMVTEEEGDVILAQKTEGGYQVIARFVPFGPLPERQAVLEFFSQQLTAEQYELINCIEFYWLSETP